MQSISLYPSPNKMRHDFESSANKFELKIDVVTINNPF